MHKYIINYDDGSKIYIYDDKVHRLDGPTVVSSTGDKSWWVNDERHRLDGPAIEYANGNKSWYIYYNDIEDIQSFLKVIGV